MAKHAKKSPKKSAGKSAKKSTAHKAPAKALKPAKPAKPAKVAKVPIFLKGPKGRMKKKVEEKPRPSFIRTGKIVPSKSTGLFITRTAAQPMETVEKSLSQPEISKFRDVLQQKREDLVQLILHKKETEFQEVEPEIGDEADIATASVEKDVLYELADVEQQTLDSVEAALRKVEKGVYGKCEVCGKQIPRKRLEVMAWARNCIYCQSQNESPAPAPVTPEAA